VPTKFDVCLRNITVEFAISEVRVLGFFRARNANWGALGECAILTFYVRHCCVDIDVARDGEDGIGRRIEVVIEGQQLIACECSQRCFAANPPATDPMHVVQERVQRLCCDGARVILFPVGFLNDDFELSRQLARVDDRVGVGVRLNLQPFGEAGGGEHGVVTRMVVDGMRVEIAAKRFGRLRDLADAALGSPFEEHVLQNVRDTNDVVCFVEIASFDVGVDRDHRSGGIAIHEHGESVGKLGAVERFRIQGRHD